jgi:short-subunit dehydrogenase
MKLENNVIVITGGTKGLGKELALSLKKEGANVIVCARKQDEINNLPNNILGVKADVTKENDLKNLVNFAVEKFGNIDIWINNAGIWLPLSSVEETDWDRAHDLMEVNLFGTVYGSKVSLIQMKKQGFGIIINIISTSALSGRLNSSAYCASKYAVDGFTKSLREEVKNTKIKVLSSYPGGMQTDFFDEKKPDNYTDYMDPKYVSDIIIKNLKREEPEEELFIKRI